MKKLLYAFPLTYPVFGKTPYTGIIGLLDQSNDALTYIFAITKLPS